MSKILIFFFILFPSLVFSQIKNEGYNNAIWGQSKEGIPSLNCTHSNGDFSYCELKNKDSLFAGQFRFSYSNYRFYKNQLSEIHFDLNPNDLGSIVSYLTNKYSKPRILEKKNTTPNVHEISIGYKWNIGDTDVLIINDGSKNPVLCILKSTKITNSYPKEVLNIEKLIFE